MLGAIADAFAKVASIIVDGIIGGIFRAIVQPFLVAAVSIVLETIKNIFAILWYEISVVLLSLIDFIEELFNALSGLNNSSGAITISLGGEGDLLLQAIRHPMILNVFYATAIVGLFLLVITTIFQMIKVEYTTEGAQNSKSGIIGKSLKSLTNMLIIPLLIVFGVFIGNQVLGLINTATRGDAHSRISGTLWVTAASPALLKNESDLALLSFTSLPSLVTVASTTAVINGLKKGIASSSLMPDDLAKDMVENVSLFGELADGNVKRTSSQETREAKFSEVAKGYEYYNVLAVGANYSIFEINYLVLLVGSCIIIKCLYHICFGMIDRLYQCIALFIIMPMVVGMSPVKDSLASWRQKFIGKALSAYGIVISMNLFFIITKLFLNLEVNVTGNVGSLGGIFLTGLIKTIFLISGCLMIEKLAGDMGSYFGAADGLSEGKKLAGDVGKVAQKGLAAGAMVGMAVASGGASLALGAKSLASKLATKAGANALTGKVAGAATNKATASGKFNAALNKISGGNVDERFTNYSNAASERDKQQNIMNDAKSHMRVADKVITDQEAILNDKNSTFEQRNEARAKIAAAEASQDKYNKIYKDALTSKISADSTMDRIGGDEKSKFNDAYKAKKDSDVANAEYDSLSAQKAKQDAAEKEAKETKAANRKAWVATRMEGLREYGKNKFGVKAIGEKFLGKEIMSIGKDMDAATKAANDTDEGKQMLANIDFAKGKKKNDNYNARHANIISEQQRIVSSKISSAVIEKVEFNQATSNLQLDKLAEGYNNAKTEDDRNWYMEQMRAINNSIQRPEGGKFDINNNANYHVNFDMTAFKKNLDEAIKKNAKTSEIEQIIQDQLAKWGQEGNTKLLNDMYKVLTELRGQLAK